MNHEHNKLLDNVGLIQLFCVERWDGTKRRICLKLMTLFRELHESMSTAKLSYLINNSSFGNQVFLISRLILTKTGSQYILTPFYGRESKSS